MPTEPIVPPSDLSGIVVRIQRLKKDLRGNLVPLMRAGGINAWAALGDMGCHIMEHLLEYWVGLFQNC